MTPITVVCSHLRNSRQSHTIL